VSPVSLSKANMLARRRRWLVGVGAVAAASVVAWLGLTLAPAPAPAPLPSPNGYDDLLKAGAAASPNVSDYGFMSNAALRQLVSTNAEALRLLRVGLGRKCAVPPATLTNSGAMLTELAGMKRLAQLLVAEAQVHTADNQPAAAADSALDSMRLGNQISRGGPLIHHLVGIACEAIGRGSLLKVLPELTPAESRRVLSALQEIDRTRVSFEEVARNERAYFYRELRNYPNPILWVRALWNFGASRQLALEKHKRIVAFNRLLATELALRCYCAERSSGPPPRLEDLVPEYLAAVPEDPFSGRPLIYRPNRTKWLLYSVGPDGVDNGGRPGRYASSRPGDIVYNQP